MRQLKLVLLVLVIFSCHSSANAQDDFSNIGAFSKSTLKRGDNLSIQAKGDLNGDGLPDWAGLVHRKQEDSSPTYQLYVLLRLREGGYHVAEKSIEEEIPGMGCCWVDSLEIRGSSIYIQSNAKTVSVMEATTHQFKLFEGNWRLVGIRSYLTDFTPGAQGTTDTDMNLLTGSVRLKRQKGKKRPVTTSRRQKFDVFLLKDFDFSIRFGNEET